MTDYPIDIIEVFQSKTKSGSLSTGWNNAAYNNYKNKKLYPLKFVIKVNLPGNTPIEIGMDEIEEFFDEKLKEIGISHFLKRNSTDFGLTMIFYTEESGAFDKLLTKLQISNELNVNFEFIKYIDVKWKTSNANLESIQSLEEINSIVDQTSKMLSQWEESGLNIKESFEIFISFYSTNKFEAESFVKTLITKQIKAVLVPTRTLIFIKGFEITVFKDEIWNEKSIRLYINEIVSIANLYLCRFETISARFSE